MSLHLPKCHIVGNHMSWLINNFAIEFWVLLLDLPSMASVCMGGRTDRGKGAGVVAPLDYRFSFEKSRNDTHRVHLLLEGGLLVLFDLILYVRSTIFQLNRDGSSWVEPVLS